MKTDRKRRRPGRPRVYGQQLHVSVSSTTLRALKRIARDTRKTMPEVIAYLVAIEDACVQHEIGVLGG